MMKDALMVFNYFKFSLKKDNFDADFAFDLRNLKSGMDEGGMYSQHSYNKTDMKRVYYIKEKKQMQRDEQNQKSGKTSIMDDLLDDDDTSYKKGKRALKSNQQTTHVIEEQKKPTNFYKTKKK
jgi:hypothetical protein